MEKQKLTTLLSIRGGGLGREIDSTQAYTTEKNLATFCALHLRFYITCVVNL